MAKYKRVRDTSGEVTDRIILRLTDSASIPNDPANADWRQYLADVDAGETVEDADPVPEPTPERVNAEEARNVLRDLDFRAAITANDTTFRALETSAGDTTTVNQLRQVVRDGLQAQRRTNDDILKLLRRLARALGLNNQLD
jgi:hypothetical protein